MTLQIEDAVYDGYAHTAVCETTGILSGWRPFAVPELVYTDADNTESTAGFKNVGTYTVTMALGGQSVTKSYTISPKELEITKIEAYSKYYDATNVLNPASLYLDGVVVYSPGAYDGEWDDVKDDVSVNRENITVTVEESIPGTYETADISGVTLKGNDAKNYTIAESFSGVPLKERGVGGTYPIREQQIFIDIFDQTLYGDAELNQEEVVVSGLDEKFTISDIELYEDDYNEEIRVNEENIVITLSDGTDVTDYFYFSITSGVLSRVCEGHELDENGFCSTGNCNTYEKAMKVTETDEYGNECEVYEIYNAGQLYWMARWINKYDNEMYVRLMADIRIPITKGQDETSLIPDWTPINGHYGTFDGNGHTISGLYCNSSELQYVGLFGSTSYNNIINLHIADSTFISTYPDGNVGAVAGSGNVVRNCTVADTVTIQGASSTAAIGGLLGATNGGDIENCYSMAEISNTHDEVANYGGLVGGWNTASISNSYTNAKNVVNYNYSNYGGSMTNCYYLAETDDDDCEGTTAVTADQFASGEVAYLLQEGIQGEEIYDEETGETVTAEPKHIWGQDIKLNASDEEYDAYPVLGGAKVYVSKVYDCPNDTEATNGYSNDTNGITRPTTHPDTTGDCMCDVCDEPIAHVDENSDCACDVCKTTVHSDTNKDGACDNCDKILAYIIAPTSRLLGTDETVANISMNPSNGYVEVGDSVTVIAPELLRYTFKGWYLSGDVDGSDQINASPQSTSLSYTFEPNADTELVAVYESAAKEATITFNKNGDFTVSVNGKEVTGTENEDTYTFLATIGDEVTITVADESFINWCNDNGKIVSTETSYTFTVTGDVTLNMTNRATAENTAMVEFVSAYNQVIASQIYTNDAAITPPSGPSKMGYIFKGWSLTEDKYTDWATTQSEIQAKITAGEKHITVVPVYEQDTSVTYTVNVYVNGEKDDTQSATGIFAGATKTVSAPTIDGKVFLYWTDKAENGTILGYDTSYFMQINKNIEIYAVYGEKEVEKQPVITMTNVYTTIEDEKKKLSFSVTRDIPEGYTLVEHGMLYHTKQTITNPSEDTFILGGDGVSKYVSTDTKLSGVFTLTVNVTTGEDVKVITRGYMIVKDTITGAEEVYYTSIENKSYSDLNQ